MRSASPAREWPLPSTSSMRRERAFLAPSTCRKHISECPHSQMLGLQSTSVQYCLQPCYRWQPPVQGSLPPGAPLGVMESCPWPGAWLTCRAGGETKGTAGCCHHARAVQVPFMGAVEPFCKQGIRNLACTISRKLRGLLRLKIKIRSSGLNSAVGSR